MRTELSLSTCRPCGLSSHSLYVQTVRTVSSHSLYVQTVRTVCPRALLLPMCRPCVCGSLPPPDVRYVWKPPLSRCATRVPPRSRTPLRIVGRVSTTDFEGLGSGTLMRPALRLGPAYGLCRMRGECVPAVCVEQPPRQRSPCTPTVAASPADANVLLSDQK